MNLVYLKKIYILYSNLQLRGDLGIMCTISIYTFVAFYKPLDKLNYLRGDNNHFSKYSM